MELDPKVCYTAILSRDRRFDGRFFTGVVTTGIYCRPVCPVHPPRFENMRFYACAAAAEAAGFRPCRRCHPEAAPGTPAWVGSSAVVSRAMRLIGEGALDEDDIEGLAARLGIGGRQLRRLFAEHLGASPTAIARARRVHFAVKLIEETRLPITEVAFLAGFRSIRQFNHAVRSTFHHSPTERRVKYGLGGKKPLETHSPNGEGLIVRLPYRPPFDWNALLSFLSSRAIPGVESILDGTYRRSVEIGGSIGIIELTPSSERPELLMRVQLSSYESLLRVSERARRIFDLGADPLQINQCLRRSPSLARAVAARPGLRVPGAWDGFELAVRAILGQQVTVKGATTLAGRLVSRFGSPLEGYASFGITHLFPGPESLMKSDLTKLGMPSRRGETIRGLARAVASGDIPLDSSQGLDNSVSSLCSVPGIGQWTANYIAMRAFGETDAFPSDDLGLRKALSKGSNLISAKDVARIAEEWRPWRAYGALYLWNQPAAIEAMKR